MNGRNVKVKQADGAEPVPAEVLAQSIVKIADATDKLFKSGLNTRAIVTLLSDSTKVGKREIETVLWGLNNLKTHYLAKSPVR